MKSKQIALCLLAGLLLLPLGACQLAREDTGAEAEDGRLVGLFLTWESVDLFNWEGYLTDNLSALTRGGGHEVQGGQPYEGKLEGTLSFRTVTSADGHSYQEPVYDFGGLEGLPLFVVRLDGGPEGDGYHTTVAHEAVTDLRLSVGDKTSLEGTVYLQPLGGSMGFYCNPVYQRPDGSVYLMSGSGTFTSGDGMVGGSMTHTVEESRETAENGEVTSEASRMQVTVTGMVPPRTVTVLEMVEGGTLLARRDYPAGETPGEMETEADFLLVESHTKGGTVERRLITQDETGFPTYVPGERGLCLPRHTEVVWN